MMISSLDSIRGSVRGNKKQIERCEVLLDVM